MGQYFHFNLERAGEMQKSVIIVRTCTVISQAETNSKHSEYVAQPCHPNGANIDEADIRITARKLLNSEQAQDLFVIIKRNLVHSKKVKDAQVAAFVKHVIKYLDPEVDIKHLQKSLEQQLEIMDCFVRYIHL
ncbi:hypothetical protein [Grimontia sp. NTOU-MAR1]|uniref:hypothetical protein n=1 Tax=Grimontia sp. NTOU-MAR1 TaxID=3111011 RepID=UPI002DBBE3D0|nr:hypothetical protein [Grimontia sp. NTOU-MAR1]WRV98382.1 hypothetical protein VP504_02805 [Grimontia sp. NTOU-MAR1]